MQGIICRLNRNKYNGLALAPKAPYRARFGFYGQRASNQATRFIERSYSVDAVSQQHQLAQA